MIVTVNRPICKVIRMSLTGVANRLPFVQRLAKL